MSTAPTTPIANARSIQLDLTQLDTLGWTIERSGVTDIPETTLAGIANEANRLGVRPIAAQILGNCAEPAAARARAFGLIAPGIARHYSPAA